MKRTLKWLAILAIVIGLYQLALYELFQHTIRDATKRFAQQEIVPLAFIVAHFPYWASETEKAKDLINTAVSLSYVEEPGDVDYGVKSAFALLADGNQRAVKDDGILALQLALSNRRPETFANVDIEPIVEKLAERSQHLADIANSENRANYGRAFIYMESALYYAMQRHDISKWDGYAHKVIAIFDGTDSRGLDINDRRYIYEKLLFYSGIALCENGDRSGAQAIRIALNDMKKKFRYFDQDLYASWDLFYLRRAQAFKDDPHSVCRGW